MGNLDSLTILVESVCLDVQTPQGGTRRILHPTTVEITERAVAIIGANGSGKSTLLRLLAGLVEPTAGRVHLPPTVSRPGFIFANPQAQLIMPVVSEDIEFSLKQAGWPRDQRRTRALEILQHMGLHERADSSVHELSSGERQKLALAGVLAVEPQLVLADEPTTLLDLRSGREFQRRLLQLSVPLIVATHDLDFAAQTDRVLVFDSGGLVADDEPTSAIAFYRKLMLG